MTTPSTRSLNTQVSSQEEAPRRFPFTHVIYYAVLIFFTIALLLPVMWLVLASFKTNAEILSASGFFPEQFRLQGYRDALTQVALGRFFLNSFIVSTSSTILTILIASMAAYPLSRFKFPFRDTLSLIFSLGIVVPVTSLIVPEVLIIRWLGLTDTKVGLILLYTALFFPLSFVILRAFFMSIPYQIEEAAIIDGASYWTLLFRLIMPLSVPGISTVGVLVFIFTWNEFLYALLLISSQENRTVQIAIRFFTSTFDFNLPGMYAAITMVMIVPITVFLLLQERVVSGLTAGATKF
jgi:raffinose/stachyose/melibiose transport system permease protein